MEWFALAFTSALLSAGSALCEKKVLFKLGALEFSFLVSLLSYSNRKKLSNING